MALKEQVGNIYSVGLNNVGSYQVAGIPYITGSTTLAAGAEDTINFPYVARSISVVNFSSNKIRIHFNATGSGNVVGGLHYLELDTDEDSYTFNVKCKRIYISADPTNGAAASYSVVAELTNILPNKMSDEYLTGSGLTD